MGPVPSSDASRTGGELLERDGEFALLQECFEVVGAGSRGQLVLVSGEAGIGKTALLRRFCEAHGRSRRVLWGGCDPLFTPRVLGPLHDIAEITGAELARSLESGARPSDVATVLMREASRRAPAIVIFEDVHWADEATLDVLGLLGRRIGTFPGLLVLTFRDQLDGAHPLRVVLGELPSAGVRRVKLLRLSLSAVSTLAERENADAERLYHQTAGNPFFVTEVLAAGGEMPESVRDAVLARASRLSASARTLLDAVAIAPPQCELWLLEALAGEALDGLEECLAAGMLVAQPHGLAFRHELARLALEESLLPNRRAALHRQALSCWRRPRRVRLTSRVSRITPRQRPMRGLS